MENDYKFRMIFKEGDKINPINAKTIHEKTKVDIEDDNYIEKLFNNDFMYDPNMSFMIGKYIASYLQFKQCDSEIHRFYYKTLKDPFDIMANNKGLHYDNGNSGKGYKVVYDKVEEKMGQEKI